MQTNQFNEVNFASLNSAIIVEQELWQAVCINCYDLVSRGVSTCASSLNYVIETALTLAKQLNLPAVLWTTNCENEQKLAALLVAINRQIQTPQQLLNK
ncbi:hypothetical protein [Pseudoalteromonas piratica]|jgi:hypothetical protein|uniref:Uncharacterized protein n=1 Tax=Pseudoalteromonas piratica TaxID=1348114 RepID=A0A0A7EDX1_9GAMM|nr:hypothetical protein [Pseudoalteromonas piratica]AIY64728.1 hypothetical protein OM33_05895 [Pseudoalteromonas piratica]